MKTFKALFIDNGLIKAGEFPECESPQRQSCRCVNYHKALASAKANAVECEDQEEAAKVLSESEMSGELFILPSGWDYVEKVRVCTDDCTCAEPCIVRVVAKLYRTDEQPEPEENQDKLWMNVIILVGQNIDRQGPSKIIQQLEEQFTITRKP